MNLSFTQRLKQADKGPYLTPRSKPVEEQKTDRNHSDFKKNHSDLKMMLKELQGRKNPQIKKQKPTKKDLSPIIKKQQKKLMQNHCTKENVGIKISFFNNKTHSKVLKQNNEYFNDLEPEQPQNFIKTIRSRPNQGQKLATHKKGIPNIGNTCYINAIIQCLFHLPQFNSYFNENWDEQQLNPNNKGVIAKYKNLYQNVMSRTRNIQISTLPLKKSISKICSLFIDFQQQDAHQFLRQLLDSMHQDLNLVTKKSEWRPLQTNGKNRNIYSLATQYWDYYKKIDQSYIYDSFCGQIYNSVVCAACNYESISFDNFLDLSLPMVKGKTQLEELLSAYFDAETLCDYYSCSICHKTIKYSTKKSQLWKAPNHLIIHLKRSQFGRKNNERIKIPVRCLNMKKYMKHSNDKTCRNALYSLQGVVLHRGMRDGGHYWSQVKQGSTWYKADDEHVEKLGDITSEYENQGSQQAYILFYKCLSN